MTLERSDLKGYEFDRMVMLFSMMDGAKEVPCAISTSAMDDLEHAARTKPNEREEQFLRLRDRNEQCASRKFLARPKGEGEDAEAITRSVSAIGTKHANHADQWLIKGRTSPSAMCRSTACRAGRF